MKKEWGLDESILSSWVLLIKKFLSWFVKFFGSCGRYRFSRRKGGKDAEIGKISGHADALRISADLFSFLNKKARQRFAPGQGEGPSQWVMNLGKGIDAKALKDRGGDVAWGDRERGGIGALFVA